MAGFSDASERGILDDATVGLGRTLYLALFKWTGTSGGGAGYTMNDDATFPTNVTEVTSGNGYSRLTVSSGNWNSATGTAPATKQTNTTFSWTAGANFGEICGWGLFTSSTVGGTTGLVCSGTLTNSVGAATSVTVSTGETFQFDSTNPIKVQLGDPSDPFA